MKHDNPLPNLVESRHTQHGNGHPHLVNNLDKIGNLTMGALSNSLIGLPSIAVFLLFFFLSFFCEWSKNTFRITNVVCVLLRGGDNLV